MGILDIFKLKKVVKEALYKFFETKDFKKEDLKVNKSSKESEKIVYDDFKLELLKIISNFFEKQKIDFIDLNSINKQKLNSNVVDSQGSNFSDLKEQKHSSKNNEKTENKLKETEGKLKETENKLKETESKLSQERAILEKHKSLYEKLKQSEHFTTNDSLEVFIFKTSQFDNLLKIYDKFKNIITSNKKLTDLDLDYYKLCLESCNSAGMELKFIETKTGDSYNYEKHNRVNDHGDYVKTVFLKGIIDSGDNLKRKSIIEC